MKMIMHRLSLIVLLLAAAPAAANGADPQTPAVLRDVGFDQRLNEQVPLDLKFTDETGAAVKLGDYFGNKPVILVMAYYRCPMLCTLGAQWARARHARHAVYAGHGLQRGHGQLRPAGDARSGGGQEEDLRRQLWTTGRRRGLALSHGPARGDRKVDPRRGLSLRLRCQARSVHSHQRHRAPDAAGPDLPLFLRHRVSRPRPAAGAGGSLGQQDRLAHGPGAALLFPL